MAQFEIIRLTFTPPQDPDQPAELKVFIDNPQEMRLSENPQLDYLPDNVEIVAPGHTPNQELYVFENHHHLTITLEEGSGDNPLEITNTSCYNFGNDMKYLDIAVAEKNGNDKIGRKTKAKNISISK